MSEDAWEGMIEPSNTLALVRDDEEPVDDEGIDWGGSVDEFGVPYEQHEQAEQVDQVREKIGGDRPDAEAPEDIRKRFASIDWTAAYETDFSIVNWLPGRLMERGQQTTIVGDGKVGKSLLVLDWAIRMAAGRSFLGDERHEPLSVLYLDKENSLRDIVTRAQSFGATRADLANLHYVQYPGFSGTLDQSTEASFELGRLVQYHHPDVVFIDTVSRFIGGKENDSDTWLQLYQLVHARLKERGVACVRLDHFGKDSGQGSRGSSAKSQDVDHVWELTRTGGGEMATPEVETITNTLKLHRTHTRSGLGVDTVNITRTAERSPGGAWIAGRTRHEVIHGEFVSVRKPVDDVVDDLIRRNVPSGMGRGSLTIWMKNHGMPGFGNVFMSEIAKALKTRQAES